MKYVQTTSSQGRRTKMVYENISGPFLSHLWSQIFSTVAKGTLFFWIYSTETSTFDLWESFSSTVYKTVSTWIGTKTIIEQNYPKFVQLKHKRRIACKYHQTFNLIISIFLLSIIKTILIKYYLEISIKLMMHNKGHGRLYRSLSLQEKPAGGLSQLLHDTTRCVWISEIIEMV